MKIIFCILEGVKKSWSYPEVGNVHYYCKFMEFIRDPTEQVDKLLILLSAIGGSKLLGIAYLLVQSSIAAGKQTANATMPLLSDWKSASCLAGVVLYLTSSNTGHKTAACIEIQN